MVRGIIRILLTIICKPRCLVVGNSFGFGLLWSAGYFACSVDSLVFWQALLTLGVVVVIECHYDHLSLGLSKAKSYSTSQPCYLISHA